MLVNGFGRLRLDKRLFMHQHREASQSGFTLIELLIVVAIIAVLASLLLPALSRARRSADMAVCCNNLRQQLIGLTLYTDDFGAFPRYETSPWTQMSQPWMYNLEAFVGGKWPGTNYSVGQKKVFSPQRANVFTCPGYNKVGGIYWANYGAYAYNASNPGQNAGIEGLGGEVLVIPIRVPEDLRPIRPDEIANPTRLIAFGDSQILTGWPGSDDDSIGGSIFAPVYWTHLEALLYYHRSTPLNAQDKATLARHSARWNMGFCDGHVESGKTDSFLDPKNPEAVRLWNRDNEPHLERIPKYN